MDESRLEQQLNEPSGVALKAAYLLLREMNSSPEPPSLERLAFLLDTILKYGPAVRLLRLSADFVAGGPDAYLERQLDEFGIWADENLMQ